MALRSTQPLNRNEYQEYFLRGEGRRCVGLTLQPSRAVCLEIWEPQGLSRPVQELPYLYLFYIYSYETKNSLELCEVFMNRPLE